MTPNKSPRRATSREWIAAALTAAALVGLIAIPIYRARLKTPWLQARDVPQRLAVSLDEMRMAQSGQPYSTMQQVKALTFENAVIVLTNDPADPPELRSIVWCSYYLYPRVLVHESTLRTDRELEADYVLTTPHFVMGLPDSLIKPKLALVPLSDRARKYTAKGTR